MEGFFSKATPRVDGRMRQDSPKFNNYFRFVHEASARFEGKAWRSKAIRLASSN
jgi:hypothetical protein